MCFINFAGIPSRTQIRIPPPCLSRSNWNGLWKPFILNWLDGKLSSILVSEMTKISIALLTMETKASNLFRREFRFKWPTIIIFSYLTRISNNDGVVDDIGEWCPRAFS